MTRSSQVSNTRANEEILGYKLEERIGAGGFGEVWRAEAPGGLYKAIKIVFGYHDEDLAQSELKALNRVKELRHPFLLSLERIEIVDGQLVVVTELADGSLKDRFAECVHQGMHGIPREELVRYLTDAADGLDFLCQKYLLQHLDVKPDNLLLVGDHVKVADYGLVKDIRDNASMLSGMTPTYSPPEVFDGRPSQLSDQYSLAVVYQEMLTGIRPYDGTTTSELARQHMLGHPNLEPLPRGDQSVVAKALSKDPTHRYGSCKEFVEQLAKRRHTGPVGKVTEKCEYDFNEPTMVLTGSDLPKKRSAELAQRMPAIECDGSFAAFHPTIVIGVGRAGTSVLSRIKQRLTQRFGRHDELPAVHFLCVDSDVEDLFHTHNSDDEARFRDEEVLGVPLQDAAAYRKSGDRYSKWLSRRWIYNIPRSRSTEGIRPLGRLAFADHSEQIMDRLHEIVQRLANNVDVEKSAIATGMTPHSTPRIFIVGSIGGGICSGMVADLAYAVRNVLLEHGLSDELIHALFLYGKGRTQTESSLAAANAYACLRELYHYAKLGYPGDPSLDLPPFDDGNTAAFSDVYFVHHDAEQCDNQQKAVADYLYLDIATSSNDFFKRCRTGRTDDGKLRLRTLGFSRFDFQQERTRAKFANAIQESLFTRWLAPIEGPIKNFNIREFVETQLNDHAINGERIVEKGNEIAEAVYGTDIAKNVLAIINDITGPNQDFYRVRELTPQVYDSLKQQADHPSDPTLLSINENITPICSEMVGGLWEKCGELIDNPTTRFGGARRVHDAIQDQLRSFRSEFRRRKAELESQLDSLDVAPDDSAEENAEPKTIDFELLSKIYAKIARVDCADALVAKIQFSSRPLQNEFERIRQLFESAQKNAHVLAEANIPPQSEGPNYESVIRGFLAEHVALFVTMLESHTDRSYFNSLGGLRKVAENGAMSSAQLANAVYGQSRFLVAGSFQGLNFDAVLDVAIPKNEDLKLIVNDQLKDALPQLTDCGGGLRLMLAVPVATPGKRLGKLCSELFNGDPTIVRGTDGDLAVCLEGESVLAEDVALLLLENSPTATEYIERIGSRLDVEWIPITGLG